jgi:hypothetical protein
MFTALFQKFNTGAGSLSSTERNMDGESSHSGLSASSSIVPDIAPRQGGEQSPVHTPDKASVLSYEARTNRPSGLAAATPSSSRPRTSMTADDQNPNLLSSPALHHRLEPQTKMKGAKYVPFVDSTLMAGLDAPRPGYGRISQSILGGFDDLNGLRGGSDSEPTMDTRQGKGKQPKTSPEPALSTCRVDVPWTSTFMGAMRPQPPGSRGYKPPSTSLFADLDEFEERSSSGFSTNTAPPNQSDRSLSEQSLRSSSSSSGSPGLGSNKPYLALVPNQHTATTASSSRSRTEGGVLSLASHVEPDDHL